MYSLVPLSSAWPSITTFTFEFSLNQAACFLKVSLDFVVKIDSFVAKNTLSGTPFANSPTVSVPMYTSPWICESIFSVVVVFLVAQAVTTKPNINTRKVFF